MTKNNTQAKAPQRHQLLMLLDEFPTLGRLTFFETELAYMAGYGIRALMIAQSLNQPQPQQQLIKQPFAPLLCIPRQLSCPVRDN